MSRTYRGRSNRRSGGARTVNPVKSTKIDLKAGAKKYFSKFLKQTGFVVAIILALYITSAVAPNFWANISPTIHAALERDINFAGMYNNVVERFFPSDDENHESGGELEKRQKNLGDDYSEGYDYYDGEHDENMEYYDVSPVYVDYYDGLA